MKAELFVAVSAVLPDLEIVTINVSFKFINLIISLK